MEGENLFKCTPFSLKYLRSMILCCKDENQSLWPALKDLISLHVHEHFVEINPHNMHF